MKRLIPGAESIDVPGSAAASTVIAGHNNGTAPIVGEREGPPGFKIDAAGRELNAFNRQVQLMVQALDGKCSGHKALPG
jgi:hypothetical protein